VRHIHKKVKQEKATAESSSQAPVQQNEQEKKQTITVKRREEKKSYFLQGVFTSPIGGVKHHLRIKERKGP